ncbi:16S rRNA (cytosine(1407)-C(5))-methyltransferase RsmF [Aeromonas molluscorum]|uniref:16S rRNA (cytosine(1407)-C(5))-methyltransferase RsmF n=1 Tax=Aeromonas molluscorum TaxID=271417 RepID=UPI003F196C89
MHDNTLLPDAFLTHIAAIMPEHLSMDEFVASCRRPLRRSIRVNTLKITVDAFLTRMQGRGWQLDPVPWCETGFWLTRPDEDQVPLGNTAEHLLGLFYIQEASSMLPVTALFAAAGVKEAELLLDAAAAPGSKSTQISALMENRGMLVANEFSSSRVKVLAANVQRCGVSNIGLSHFDAKVFGQWLPETFDAILLDAPCSGEGTVRKDDQAFRNWSLASINEIAEVQRTLLESAFHALKPGGVIVYSTCTLSHEENQNICRFMSERFGNALSFESLADLFPGAEQATTAEGYLHVWPQIYDSEGFFVARLRKHHSVANPMFKPGRLGKFPFTPMDSRDAEVLIAELDRDYGLVPQGSLFVRDDEIWLFPLPFAPRLMNKIRLDRIGLKLAQTHKKGYRLTHEWALAQGHLASKGWVELDSEQAREFMMGRDLHPQGESGQGEVILRYQGYALGLGKWVGSRIKNALPRDLVRDANLFES